ncbi:hypothetical protein [Undibacterium sp. Xuan67W]|uniref:hypothetical protein n=1 Tax=Undibacterium sp. Xuan67W TaxID=3413057 RepID=UPI003BF07D4A
MTTAAQKIQASKAAAQKKRKATGDASKKDKKKPAKKTKTGHISTSNTAAYHYFDRKNVKAVCQDDKKRIRKACNDKADAEEESKKSVDSARLDPKKTNATTRSLTTTLKKGLTAIDGLGKKKSGYTQNDSNKWMENHCGGLWNKPGGVTDPKGEKIPNTEAFKEQIKDKVGDLTKAAEDVEKVAKEKLENYAKDYFKDHAKDVMDSAAEKAAKRIALIRTPALAGLVSRLGMWESMGQLIGNAAGAIVTGDIETKFNAVVKTVEDSVAKVAEYKKLLTTGLEDAMASTMAGIAVANPCIKARKCLLVPYKDADKTAKGNGCCPGQTGHHVLPSAMFNKYAPVTDAKGKTTMKADGKRDCWKNYDHDQALTMCLEGTTNRATNGSHGLAHAGTAEILQDQRNSPDMPYTKARDEISTMFSKAYGCNAKCIQAQLDDSLKDKHSCGDLKKAQVTPHSGESGGGPKVDGGKND